MCGILAAMTRRPLARSLVQRALHTLHHRGPDGSGLWQSKDGLCALGHTRLSIIGLENGQQPITHAEGSIHLAVNGELYGYREIRDRLQAEGVRFTTDSDSEIALHLYRRHGIAATRSMRGEFSALIVDERQRAIYAVRDRFGIKPLFYAVVNGEIYFASEIKALLALGVPARWDERAMYADAYMARPHETTLFAGIRTVPPGCYAIGHEGQVDIYRYWDWTFPTAEQMATADRASEDVVQEFRTVLTDAVRQRLIADVEVASYLSGGIDSCAVLGLAQRDMQRPIRAFTLTFDDPLYNESSLAEAQAKRVGADFIPIPVTGRDIADAFAEAIWHAESVMFNGHGVAKFLLSRAVRDAGVKVVFTGEGADELFGGYVPFRKDSVLHNPKLNDEQRRSLIEEMFGANAATRAWMMADDAANPMFEGIRGRLGWLPSFFEAYSQQGVRAMPFFRSDYLARMTDFDPFAALLDRLPLTTHIDGRDRLHQALYINAKLVLANLVLVYLGDRMEMAHSVEGRVPFLDHRVAEVAARVPLDMKIKGIREKHVLREATKDVLIPEVYDRQKHPFTTPPVRDPTDPLMTFYRDTFASRAAQEQPFFEPSAMQATLQQLLQCPPDQRIAVESVVQRIVSVVVMHERFAMT